jgi:hypothetical protein
MFRADRLGKPIEGLRAGKALVFIGSAGIEVLHMGGASSSLLGRA